MSEFTPAQVKVIETWTEKRDLLLRDIGVYETQKSILVKECTDKAESLTELNKSISEAKGRIAELVALEERYKTSLSKEVSDLEVRKSVLDTECSERESKLNLLNIEIGAKTEIIESMVLMNDKMTDNAKIIEKTVGVIIGNSEKHTADTSEKITDIDAVVTSVIDKSNNVIEQANIVLAELPRYIFELQKPIRLRKSFAAPPSAVIKPKK